MKAEDLQQTDNPNADSKPGQDNVKNHCQQKMSILLKKTRLENHNEQFQDQESLGFQTNSIDFSQIADFSKAQQEKDSLNETQQINNIKNQLQQKILSKCNQQPFVSQNNEQIQSGVKLQMREEQESKETKIKNARYDKNSIQPEEGYQKSQENLNFPNKNGRQILNICKDVQGEKQQLEIASKDRQKQMKQNNKEFSAFKDQNEQLSQKKQDKDEIAQNQDKNEGFSCESRSINPSSMQIRRMINHKNTLIHYDDNWWIHTVQESVEQSISNLLVQKNIVQEFVEQFIANTLILKNPERDSSQISFQEFLGELMDEQLAQIIKMNSLEMNAASSNSSSFIKHSYIHELQVLSISNSIIGEEMLEDFLRIIDNERDQFQRVFSNSIYSNISQSSSIASSSLNQFQLAQLDHTAIKKGPLLPDHQGNVLQENTPILKQELVEGDDLNDQQRSFVQSFNKSYIQNSLLNLTDEERSFINEGNQQQDQADPPNQLHIVEERQQQQSDSESQSEQFIIPIPQNQQQPSDENQSQDKQLSVPSDDQEQPSQSNQSFQQEDSIIDSQPESDSSDDSAGTACSQLLDFG